jgi:adhesin/invasin
VGNNTVTATIGGQAVTSQAPTITVTATPGPADPGQSTVAVSPASVPTGGTSTITLTAKDAAGTALTTGGATVTFALGAGTTIGTIGPVTDNGNGTYTATFTATAAGSNTITATINTQTVTSQAPTITVTVAAGTADPAQTTVSVSPNVIQSGGTAIVTLTAKDASGTPLTTGGLAVVFKLASTSGGLGSFGSVIDNGDGTYTSTFTGAETGTNTITATIDGTALTSQAPIITIQ